jgi:hypothetical protein
MVASLKTLSIINKKYDRHMIQTRYKGDYTSSSITTPWTKGRFYPIMTLGMAPLRWWMPPMKMDLRCPSTPAAPWQALGVLLPHGDLPWAWQ